MPFVPGIFSDAIQGPIPDESVGDADAFTGSGAALAGTATDTQFRVWSKWGAGTPFITGNGDVGMFAVNTSSAGVVNVSGRTPDVVVTGFTNASNNAQYGATVLGVSATNFVTVFVAGSSQMIVTKMSAGTPAVVTSTTTGISTGDTVPRTVRARVEWPWIRGYWSGATTSTISYQLDAAEQTTYAAAAQCGFWLQHTAAVTHFTVDDV